jgi:hypothetical protein
MRALSTPQLLSITDTSEGTFGSQIKRNETVLAFGLERKLAGGVYLDLDAVAMLLVDELTSALGRKIATTIVRSHSDTWLRAVARVDTTREPVFFVVSEYGEPSRHPYFGGRSLRDKQRVGQTTMTEGDRKGFADNPDVEVPERVTWINVTSILRRIRVRAVKIGLDLSDPFFPPETDPTAKKLLDMARKDRAKALAWYAEQRLPPAE